MSPILISSHRRADEAVLLGPDGAVNAADFYAQARRVAAALPERGDVINVCATRHGFMVGFAAALLRGRVSLLPHARGRDAWLALQRRHAGSFVLGETLEVGVDGVSIHPVLAERSAGDFEVPAIDPATGAAILFTSGSTGEPTAHPKTWGQLCRGASLLAAALGWDASPPQALVGSLAPQHMFGLESTVMLAWQSGVPVHAGQPLLPADLEAALRDCGRPAWWMTTPGLLRAPRHAAIARGQLQGIVASTMSLPALLAREAESAWHVPVLEIYGSTETGALASRRTASEALWTPLPGVAVQARGEKEGPGLLARGSHFEGDVALGDVLDVEADGRFRWLGRAGDLVKIGGKRTSLPALNLALVGIPGISDGVFAFAPDARANGDESGPTRRLAAFYVSEALGPEQVLGALRELVDPAFLPRPLRRVAHLPRNANGKLTQAALAGLFAPQATAQAIADDHPALPGHFIGSPLVPGVTLLARVSAELRERFPGVAPGELLHARFHAPLRPGESFVISARREEDRVRFEVRRSGAEEARHAVIASGEWALCSGALPP